MRRQDCSQLDAQMRQLEVWENQQYSKIDKTLAEERTVRAAARKGLADTMAAKPVESASPRICVLKRSRVCPTETMRTPDEVGAYVERLRKALVDALQDNDAVRLGD